MVPAPRFRVQQCLARARQALDVRGERVMSTFSIDNLTRPRDSSNHSSQPLAAIDRTMVRRLLRLQTDQPSGRPLMIALPAVCFRLPNAP